MEIDPNRYERKVRTLFVSDVHLGCRHAQTEQFLAYLRSVLPEQLYLLGDFLDGWKLRSKWNWSRTNSAILARLVEMTECGTELYYTPGNHDDFLRDPLLKDLLSRSGIPVRISDEFVHETIDGRRFVLLHGDQFDSIECRHQWLSHLLSVAYEPLLAAERMYQDLSRQGRRPYSVCSRVKHRAKSLARFFSRFEERLCEHVARRQCDGLICGHIHTPTILHLKKFTYINTGDWVENCTAVVETFDGQMMIEPFYAMRQEAVQIAEPSSAVETSLLRSGGLGHASYANASMPAPQRVVTSK